MGRFLLYGSFDALVTVGGWFYSQHQTVPEWAHLVMLALVAVLVYGYAEKAVDDGDIGRSQVKKSERPRLFNRLVLAHRILAGLILALAVWVLFA